MLLWALLSVTLSVVGHLYQGRSRVIYHLLFAAMAVVMTVLTGNILMATAMHLYANLITVLKVWSVTDSTVAEQKVAPSKSVAAEEI